MGIRPHENTIASYLRKRFLLEGRDDYFGLWSLFRELKIEFKISKFEEAKPIVLNVLRGLLAENLVQPMSFNAQGKLDAWLEAGLPAYKKIVSDLEILNREPDVQDICWFELTSDGIIESNRIRE
jgi:hypothetical protein